MAGAEGENSRKSVRNNRGNAKRQKREKPIPYFARPRFRDLVSFFFQIFREFHGLVREPVVKRRLGRKRTCRRRGPRYRARMKLNPLVVMLALCAAPLVVSVDAQVKIDLDKPSTPTTDPNAKKDDKKKSEEKKKEEGEGKIEGIEIKRGKGFMGIQVVNGNFKLTFYDEKKKPTPIPAEVARAVLRWNTGYQQKDERAILNPGEDGKSLTSTKTVKPPLNFKLHIVLQPAGAAEESASESFVVDFHGSY
jgi:hypothetical protein